MRGVGKIAALKDRILDDIQSGVLKAGDKLLSRHQFMKRYGCSRGSIDQAISELIEDGFLYSRQGAGTYVADTHRESLNSIHTVYIVGNFDRLQAGAFFLDPGSTASCIQRHADCMICSMADLNMNLNKMARRGNAVIWDRPDYQHLMAMNFLDKAGVRQLLLHRTFGNYDYIATDSRHGIAAGLDWLTGRAGQKIAFLSTRTSTRYPYVAERQLQFFELAIRHSLTIPPEWLFTDWEHEPETAAHMEEVAEILFSGPVPCRGIYLDYVIWSTALLRAASRRGLENGRNFHLLTFDTDLGLTRQPGIAMIRQNLDEQNDKIIEWLNNRSNAPMRLKIKPQLLISR
jgi:DNA-binding LacI/PurR family transcriptional regulator